MDLPDGVAFIRNNTGAEGSIRANERQRVSQDLHNATSQLLTALQLHIGQLGRQDLPTVVPIIAEMGLLIEEIRVSIKEIGTEQLQDGHNCCEPNAAIAKRFYALRHWDAPAS
ncbi:hypothetical protein LZ016_03215 [Sphingomonas sp. SM33]|uniref:Signal transduction histidine kinase subgroup 3 dimerisation and phosphoacceptor domain-containing protein n=1 Tax=Sphingomonas telluris TaxID=2907998 RepID=A0ABS9VJG6_9SPHN|nr:hypothetical protein [Sphingomonas telluris]MCH8615117.1 hypothetical protein [Sphingomonas telluris]